jgi:hypothetical protein
MSLLLKIMDSWATRFDDSKYPRDFYLQMLASLSTAQESEKMGRCVIRMLQWKDGKVQLDPNGNVTVNGFRYAIRRTKPNTYDPKVHDAVFFSNRFFVWTQEVKKRRDFSSDLIGQVSGHGLWPRTSLVIPTFLLHILNPRVFPIFDQHVERARRFLMGQGLNASSVSLRLDDYAQYTLFWFELLSDLSIDVTTVEYGRVKHVDEALWAMGKHLKQTQKAGMAQPTVFNGALSGTARHDSVTTSSPEFKNAVLTYASSMRQSAAMEHAAREFGIHLPGSYLQYPGSHINRWRRQGFPK